MIRSYLKEHTNPPVFIGSAVVVLGLVVLGVISPAGVSAVASKVNSFITGNFEWLYLFGATAFVIFAGFLMFSRFGSIKLGPNDSEPEYSNLSWFAMLFTAGMGIGLVYYAVSEPISHYLKPPVGPGGTPGDADQAMVYTFFHWGLHPWAIYSVLGLTLGYFSFRRGLPLRPASALYPIFGKKIYGWPGAIVDILAVFGTLFGLATSLGLGGQQVGAGLATLFGFENTTWLQIIIILAITSVAVVSVMLGVDKGVRNLSLGNLWLAFGLMVLVFVLGPTRDLLNVLVSNIGNYLQQLPALSLNTFPDGGQQAQDWQDKWTLFYWGWWISWSPFVGMFLARISYGRTIRAFSAGAILGPVGASMVWLTIFGDSALSMLRNDPGNELGKAPADTAMFSLLHQLPVPGGVSTVFSVLAIIVVVLFFATSSDSGSLVVDILTNGGDPNPIWQQRLFWAVLEGAVACVLLLVGATSGEDALSALQTASIVAGLPFCVVLILMAVCLTMALRREKFHGPKITEPNPLASMREASIRMAGPREEERIAKEQAENGSESSTDSDDPEYASAAGDPEPRPRPGSTGTAGSTGTTGTGTTGATRED